MWVYLIPRGTRVSIQTDQQWTTTVLQKEIIFEQNSIVSIVSNEIVFTEKSSYYYVHKNDLKRIR